MQFTFQDSEILSYLGLPKDYDPLPSAFPVEFLKKHLHQLPPHIIQRFSLVTTPKQRTLITEIRNRRLKFTESGPRCLSFTGARNAWPALWQGRERRGQEEAKEEQEWVAKSFLDGSGQQVGKLGKLLGEFEEEREAEKVRVIRRMQANDEFVPEEEDSESEEENEVPDIQEVDESSEEAKTLFERRIKERFIYGLLEGADYDSVDWDEGLDVEDKNAEERWFDDDDE
ncbi:hypothetical protein K503DRAFT_861338 [Rhizopogon vinicolor AM-OR11-026]|uniref:CCD97-like C-terminal domain-containing protein n=1 Tax=Rhizopogon vinicolor AM-OR11-026 TaxID=1314800 RepID=A0A1B7NHT0_9AGAM|nr:hypothetical protein K503DRAFT_861338 [Rhizopogon vinicolor AM-OR11-026]